MKVTDIYLTDSDIESLKINGTLTWNSIGQQIMLHYVKSDLPSIPRAEEESEEMLNVARK